MSYPGVTFKRVFEAMVRATGIPVATIVSLSADEQERYAGLINDALKDFWDYAFWPGTFEIEQRTIDPTGLHILKAATGETEIGNIDPLECFYDDVPIPGSLKHVLSEVEDRGDRIVCYDDGCPAEPYIRFQLPCPQFTRDAYAVGTTYGLGELVYDATSGNCYKSAAAANVGHALSLAAWWTAVPFPALALTYVKWSASSEVMAEDDGKYQQAARAQRELERLEELFRYVGNAGR